MKESDAHKIQCNTLKIKIESNELIYLWLITN